MGVARRVALSWLLLFTACAGERSAGQPRTPSVEPTPAGDPMHEPSQTGTGTGTEAPADGAPGSEPAADTPSGGPSSGRALQPSEERAFHAARESASAARYPLRTDAPTVPSTSASR
jgi:hypothetical protein